MKLEKGSKVKISILTAATVVALKLPLAAQDWPPAGSIIVPPAAVVAKINTVQARILYMNRSEVPAACNSARALACAKDRRRIDGGTACTIIMPRGMPADLAAAVLDAGPRRIGFTVTFDNLALPAQAGGCTDYCY
jgi:hypothetical protein